MSEYVDIMMISDTNLNDVPVLEPEEVCHLLEHKNRFISDVYPISLEDDRFNDILGRYCIRKGNQVMFQMKHYSQVMLPLWKEFQRAVRDFDFLDFTSEEGIQKIAFERAYSPNIIYYDPVEGSFGYSLEDFFRSEKFAAGKSYTLHCVYERFE